LYTNLKRLEKIGFLPCSAFLQIKNSGFSEKKKVKGRLFEIFKNARENSL